MNVKINETNKSRSDEVFQSLHNQGCYDIRFEFDFSRVIYMSPDEVACNESVETVLNRIDGIVEEIEPEEDTTVADFIDEKIEELFEVVSKKFKLVTGDGTPKDYLVVDRFKEMLVKYVAHNNKSNYPERFDEVFTQLHNQGCEDIRMSEDRKYVLFYAPDEAEHKEEFEKMLADIDEVKNRYNNEAGDTNG